MERGTDLGSEHSYMRCPGDEGSDSTAMGATLAPEQLNKPLPRLSIKQKGRILPVRARLALEAVSTNLRVKKEVISGVGSSTSPRKGPGIYVSKPSPLLVRDVGPGSSGFELLPQSPNLEDAHIQSIESGSAAAMLSKRIEALAAQHERSLLQSQQRMTSGLAVDGGQARFHKGKEAFGRVKKAINRRLNGHADQYLDSTKCDSPLMGRDSDDSSSFEGVGSQSGYNRHPTPGIQTPIEHLIPRKPIGTENETVLKGRRARFSSLDDPFSDFCVMDSNDQPSAHRDRSSKAGLNLSLNPFRVRRNEEPPRGRQLHRSPVERDEHIFTNLLGSSADTIPRQSAPAIDLLSSSPDNYSTPRLRLEPKVEADGMKRLMSVRSDRTTPLGYFSFELDPERESSWDQSDVDNQPSKDPPSTLKRENSGKRESSTSPTPAQKKVKQEASAQEDGLAASMADLEMPLPPRDLTRPAKALIRRLHRVRGLSMFDVRSTDRKSDGTWVKL